MRYYAKYVRIEYEWGEGINTLFGDVEPFSPIWVVIAAAEDFSESGIVSR
jgi:hypothetical protein